MASVAAEALAHLSGWVAVFTLLGSLALSLASRFVGEQRPRLVAWRRRAGLTGWAAALAHASVALLGVLSPQGPGDALAVLSAVPYLRHGALALALLTPLAITSFPSLNARAGLRTWSTLHRAVYLALVLAVLHVLAGPSADPRLAVALAALLAVLLLARLAPRPRRRADDGSSAEPALARELTKESGDSP